MELSKVYGNGSLIGLEPRIYYLSCYDATWIFALGLNKTLYGKASTGINIIFIIIVTHVREVECITKKMFPVCNYHSGLVLFFLHCI